MPSSEGIDCGLGRHFKTDHPTERLLAQRTARKFDCCFCEYVSPYVICTYLKTSGIFKN
jgi:hypothetical protein